MAKGKLKLSLIEDYIVLCRLDAEFSYLAACCSTLWKKGICAEASKICKGHLKLAKQVIFRLGLMDFSFSLLNMQLQAAVNIKLNDVAALQTSLDEMLSKLYKLKEVTNRQKTLIKKFKLTQAETAYLGLC